MLEWMVRSTLEYEMGEHLGAEPYERRGYRNGYKPRFFTAELGDLKLLVLQERDGTFSTSIFARCERSDKALTLSLMEMYLQGASTLKVAAITETLCGRDFIS